MKKYEKENFYFIKFKEEKDLKIIENVGGEVLREFKSLKNVITAYLTEDQVKKLHEDVRIERIEQNRTGSFYSDGSFD